MLIALFVLVRLCESSAGAPGWVRWYADDLLCLPLVLSLALTVRRGALRSAREYLPWSHGLLAVVFFTVVFEILLPRFAVSAVADPWDVLMYLAGLLVFQVGLNRPERGAPPLRAGNFVPTLPG